MDEEEVCGKLNFCYYGGMGPGLPIPLGSEDEKESNVNEFETVDSRQIQYSPASALSKVDMIKVVQLTDVHIDHEYLTVGDTLLRHTVLTVCPIV